MANLSATISGGIITLIDNSGNVQRISSPIATVSAAVTACFYEPYYQIGTGSSVLTLPAATVWFGFIRNLHASNTISVTATPAGGSPWSSALVLPTGGIFMICAPYSSNPAAGGITAISVLASGSATPAEIFLAA